MSVVLKYITTVSVTAIQPWRNEFAHTKAITTMAKMMVIIPILTITYTINRNHYMAAILVIDAIIISLPLGTGRYCVP